jgi:hypothetical protein
MLRACLFVAFAALALCLLPAAVHARSQPLNVSLHNDDGTAPVVGVKVDVRDLNGNLLGSGVTNGNGNAGITVDVPDGVDKVLVEVPGDKGHGAFQVLDVSKVSPSGFGFAMYTSSRDSSGADLLELAKRAIARCDKAAYDRWVAALDRRIADLEKNVDKDQQNADAYARANNLRVTDLAGARKDKQRAAKAQEKLSPALRNDDMLETLADYIELLEIVDYDKSNLEEARRAHEAMPPFPPDCKKDKVGYLPGGKTCPDGSGGMLAGALNDIFDSDLDPVCDKGPRHRDTDHPRKDHGEREHGRD